jgi:modulator of FtsH protease
MPDNARMESGVATGWSDFFVASAGAASALAGLVFVSLSINLERIIKLPGVSGRAAETLMLLAGSLSAALITLIPQLSPVQLGLALCVVVLPTWIAPMVIQRRAVRHHVYPNRWSAVRRTLLHQTATLPGVLAALSLCNLLPGGIAWLAVGVIASILVAVVNAWVLLVEIVR